LSEWLFFILFRLWQLQVIQGNEFRRLSENNRIRIRENPADRGLVLDRKERVLAHNRPSYEVYLVPEDLKANPEVVEKVAEILKMVPAEVNGKLQGLKYRAPFRPVKIKSDIDWNELVLIESNRVHLPGLFVDVRPTRAYTYGSLASHLIGYLGEVDENELRQAKERGYRAGAMIGKYGIENQWETDLKGMDGGRQIEVDAHGREIQLFEALNLSQAINPSSHRPRSERAKRPFRIRMELSSRWRSKPAEFWRW
jgi:penicillin-binding protein 2